jgi:hypothetical protein
MRGSGWFGGRGPPVGMGLGVSGRHPLREWWILARNAMNHKSMDVFSLRDSIVGEYRKFATSFTTIRAEDIRAQVEAIYSEGRFWPDPLLQINPSYKRGLDLETLIQNRALDPRTAEIFPPTGRPSPCTSTSLRPSSWPHEVRATSSPRARILASRCASSSRS